jgi:2-methylaconitate cis-trans-isomerase PrpF
MDQIATPAVFMRGGTSKGLFFRAEDLPEDEQVRDRLFLAALGSPDAYGRQLDGMGGGISSLSKIMSVKPSDREGVDVDYLFGQVAVERPLVDYNSNCGNLSAAIGPYAVDEGLVKLRDGQAEVHVFNENTQKTVINRFDVKGGKAAVTGDYALDGVSGGGAPVELVFPDPGGAATGRLLPTGNSLDVLMPAGYPVIETSLVDATNPVVFVRARDVGILGTEGPDELAANRDLLRHLEAIRREAAVAMRLAKDTDDAARNWASSPKIAVVSPPAATMLLDGNTLESSAADLVVRVISMGIPHRAVPQTSALCLSVAVQISGTVAAEALGDAALPLVRLAHPSGVQEISAVVENDGDWRAVEIAVTRTVRRLMAGEVYVPKARLEA